MSFFNNNIIKLLVKKGLAFAIYSLPNSKDYRLVVQKGKELFKTEFEDIENIDAFIVAEFRSAKTNIINYIKPDFSYKSTNDISGLIKYLNSLDNHEYEGKNNQYAYLSKIEYLGKTDYLIDKLKAKELQKIVISRISAMELASNLDLDLFIEKSFKKYPEAFVYMINSEETGIWTGASPELLLKKSKGVVETNAIAGTQLLSDYETKHYWGQKELEEQQLVSSYIEKLLSELGLKDYNASGPETIKAGNLVHLKTTFKIPSTGLNKKLGVFIKGLHPTPAVCGLPKAAAFHMIENAESHERELYTGFIGPWNLNGSSQLFVNLRCAKILDNKVLFYVGGGLTASSDAKAEWMETVNKTKTLLSVIENL
jgi:isochorismate synthase